MKVQGGNRAIRHRPSRNLVVGLLHRLGRKHRLCRPVLDRGTSLASPRHVPSLQHPLHPTLIPPCSSSNRAGGRTGFENGGVGDVVVDRQRLPRRRPQPDQVRRAVEPRAEAEIRLADRQGRGV